MRVAVEVSKKVFCRWPDEYVGELINKLKIRGDDVYLIMEDTEPELARKIVAESECFVGPVGELYEYAGGAGVRRVGLLGATEKGEGVVSPIGCRGCLDKLDGQVDCFFGDELCMYEITPNDVLGALCG